MCPPHTVCIWKAVFWIRIRIESGPVFGIRRLQTKWLFFKITHFSTVQQYSSNKKHYLKFQTGLKNPSPINPNPKRCKIVCILSTEYGTVYNPNQRMVIFAPKLVWLELKKWTSILGLVAQSCNPATWDGWRLPDLASPFGRWIHEPPFGYTDGI